MVASALHEQGVPHVVQAAGSMFSVFFSLDDDGPAVRDLAGAQTAGRAPLRSVLPTRC
jgi:glutamate-1-semialdehyde aminotransferase